MLSPKSIDLNCDVGEISFAQDRTLLPYVSSCSVCCGAHAGDPVLIVSTIQEALRLNVAVGAHPSYPDRDNFGRHSLSIARQELAAHLRFQIGSVKAVVESFGGRLNHVKPHGALYHDVIQNRNQAAILLDVIADIDDTLLIYGQADSEMSDACQAKGLQFVHEAFGDRLYADRTRLAARSHPSAVLEHISDFDAHLNRLATGRVMDVDGRTHSLTVDSICLHGDTRMAIEFAKQARKTLAASQIRVESPKASCRK